MKKKTLPVPEAEPNLEALLNARFRSWVQNGGASKSLKDTFYQDTFSQSDKSTDRLPQETEPPTSKDNLRALRNQRPISRTKSSKQILLRFEADKILWRGKPIRLRPMPAKIVRYLTKHPNKWLSRQEVMQNVGMLEGSVSAFHTHLNAIRKVIDTPRKKPTPKNKRGPSRATPSRIECPRLKESIRLKLTSEQIFP